MAPLILAVLGSCQSSATSQDSSNNNKAAANSESALSEDQRIQKGIIDIVARQLEIEQGSVDINIPLSKQKAPADELDVVEIILTIEEKLGVEIKDEEIGETAPGRNNRSNCKETYRSRIEEEESLTQAPPNSNSTASRADLHYIRGTMQEWYDFEREAINQLRQHFRSIIIQVLDRPSFGLPAAWSVEERGGRSHGERYSCTYEVWSRYYDYKRYSDPLERVWDLNRLRKPTITRRVVDTVPDEEALALLRRAETLPAISPRVAVGTQPISLDGVLTEVAFSSGSAKVRYSWTNEAPAHWQVVAAYAEEVRSFIRTASQQHGWLVDSQTN